MAHATSGGTPFYGMLAEFESAQALLNAVRRSLQSCQDTSTYRMLLLNLANTAEAAESNQRRFVA